MYVKSIKKDVVRKPPDRVFRKQNYTVLDNGNIHWDKSDPIPRENKWKYDFIVCESYRENGKVKTKQKHIGTVSYWDIVDRTYFVLGMNIEKYYGDEDALYTMVWDLVEEKFNPIEQEILAEYEKTEEYTVREYWLREEKRVADEIQKQRVREEEEKRKRDDEQWQYYKSFFNGNSASTSTGGVIKNKELAKELIKAGFRKLSVKYHPDSGGTDGQQFKELTNIKEQLDKFIQ